ncbi:MAG: hypothetical protein Kow00109_01010 [Acidobacteriota bacterium]
MRRWVWFLFMVAAGAAFAYWSGCWNDPRVRSLVVSRGTDRAEAPLRFLEKLPSPGPPPRRPADREKAPPRARSTAPSEPEPPRPSEANQVPNAVVARTLLQILRAQGLASGISLAVTDTEVQVYGAVPSAERLRRIVAVLERGREARRINVDAVTIEPGSPGGDADP